MRLVGILALVLGVVGSAWAVARALSARRPLDLAWALAAPVAVVLAVIGLVTVIVPSFP